MNRRERLGTLAAVIGNSIFGFSFMFTRIALNVALPSVLLMHRFLLAFALLNIVALWAAKLRRHAPVRADEVDWLRFDLKGKPVLPLILMGIVQPVGYFLCENYGIRLTNSTFAGVIIATAPMVGLVAGIFTLGEIPKKSQVLFSLISIVGVALMTLQQRSDGTIQMLGLLLLIGAVCCGTAFNVISRKLSTRFSALERTYVMMGVAAVSFSCMALVQCRGDYSQILAPMRDAGFAAALLYLGFVSSIVAFMALNVAGGCLPLAKNMAFCNLTTVISLFAGVIFLHEPFNGVSLAASVLILIGIWGVQRADAEKAK